MDQGQMDQRPLPGRRGLEESRADRHQGADTIGIQHHAPAYLECELVNGNGFASGAMLVILGTLLISQVTAGKALQRLGVIS
jgi:hypothetical protein